MFGITPIRPEKDDLSSNTYGIKIEADTSDSLTKITELTSVVEKLTQAVNDCVGAFKSLAEVEKKNIKEPTRKERVFLGGINFKAHGR